MRPRPREAVSSPQGRPLPKQMGCKAGMVAWAMESLLLKSSLATIQVVFEGP